MSPEIAANEVRRMERWAINDAARVLYRLLKRRGCKIVNVELDGTEDDLAMVFAIGERAAELREAFEIVRARHAKETP